MKTALVCGAGGFIGAHLVKQLKKEGFWVRGVDLKYPPYAPTQADEFIIGDLRNPNIVEDIMRAPWQDLQMNKGLKVDINIDKSFDEVYQLAADMGGAGFVFTGENDADIMHNSALINLNICEWAYKYGVKKIFYSSSACIYPEYNQKDPNNPKTSEDSAYPANPDSEYGWEKLFSEHLYLAFQRNFGLNVRIARFHNIFGPEGSWNDGREKAPAALCRKVAMAPDNGEIEIWGDGEQTRSFLFVDECIEGVRRLMNSDFTGPVNIGSEEMVTINQLAQMIMQIEGKNLSIKHIPGPLGVRGRNSDNNLIKEKLEWAPDFPLAKGLEITYEWINDQVNKEISNKKADS